jgi:glucan-binding YG repeat protein/Leucine-rich repeat (LRR) protein
MKEKKIVCYLVILMMIMNFFAPVGRVFADEFSSVQDNLDQPLQKEAKVESTYDVISSNGVGTKKESIGDSNQNQEGSLTEQSKSTATKVSFIDPILETEVRKSLGIQDREVMSTDMENLYYLSLSNLGITNLTGLEFAVNLSSLDLSENKISSIDPISGLKNIKELDLTGNPVSNDPEMDQKITSTIQSAEVVGSSNPETRNVAPGNLYIVNIKSSDQEAQIFWSFFGNTKPTSYKIYLDNSEVTEITGNQYTFTNLQADTHYLLKVAAVRDGQLTGEFDQVYFLTAPNPTGDVVTFEDASLEDAVREQLFISNRDLRASDLERLNFLDIENKGIKSLKGLEYAINLSSLYLLGNEISDLSPISKLSSLAYLDLSYNPIESIAEISNLKDLQSLNLSGTKITDISQVLNYTNLSWLGIRDSNVSKSEESTKATLAELKERGVEVYFKELGYIYLRGTTLEDQITLNWDYFKGDDEPPTSYKIYLNGIEAAEVRGTQYTISNLNPETQYEIKIAGVKDGELTGEESISPFTTPALPTGETVKIEDANLEAAIRNELGLYKRELRESDLASLRELYLNNKRIKSLSGLEYAINLEFLSIYGNQIQDLSPLKSIKSLRYLDAGFNRIIDINPLSNLINLDYLTLWRNQVTNISALSGLTNLKYLDLESNILTDLTPLSQFTNLSILYLAGNPVSDIEPLRSLTNLNYLSLENVKLDLSEGSSAANIIKYLRDNGVDVYTNGDFNESLFLDNYNITDTSVDLNWYGNFLPESVESAKVKIYTYGETGSIPDDVYGDVYNDVYGDVYNDVYQDVYGSSNFVAEYDVVYNDKSFTVTGLNPSTHYRIELSLVLNNGNEVSASNSVTTKWPKENTVENVSFKVIDQNDEIIPGWGISIEGADEANKNVLLYGFLNQNGVFQSDSIQGGTKLDLPEGSYNVFVYGNEKYGNSIHKVKITKDGVFPIVIHVYEIANDTTAPAKPVVNEVTDQDTVVKGTAEAGSTVEVRNGTTVLVTTTAKADGSFEATIDKQPAGTMLAITAKDVAGNVSEATTMTVSQTDGWKLQNGKWYFYDSSKSVTGWKLLGVNWYYFDNSGIMQTGWVFTGGKWYYLEPGGTMQTGWVFTGGKWYYLEPGGTMQTGWVFTGGKWYYLEPGGAMQTGWVFTGGKWYYLEPGGTMQTGWVFTGGKWYYFEPGGTMQTGWVFTGGKWYYLEPGGTMQTGWINTGGLWYHFDSSGAMNTGWLYLGSNWYYLNSSGEMVTGWKEIGSTWYYFYNGGSMASNTFIGVYKIDSNGAWVH